jgi:hypothetical protein
MKQIDFTKPGGFPMTQDQLAYMQAAYTETIKGLAAMGVDGATPYVLSGAVVSRTIVAGTLYTYAVTAGWIVYGGEVIRVDASALNIDESINAAYLSIIATITPLTYYDTSTHNVISDKGISIAAFPLGTADDGTKYLWNHQEPFGAGFGKKNREVAFATIAVATVVGLGGVTGTIYYKLDYTTNTVHIKGRLSAGNAQNFVATPVWTQYSMGTLPGGYWPGTTVPFICWASDRSGIRMKDDAAFAYIDQVNARISAAGEILIDFTKPTVAVAGYEVDFNFIYALD